jgi:two-component system, sensor histidine kinase PdtaS
MHARVILLTCFLMVACRNENAHKKDDLSRGFLTFLEKANDNKSPIISRLSYGLKADSVAEHNDDTREKMLSSRALATLYLKLGDIDKAGALFHRSTEYAKALLDTVNEAISINNTGAFYNEISEYDTALKYYTTANKLFQKIGDRLQVGESMVNMGIALKNMTKYEEAFIITYEATKILDSMHAKKGLGHAYTTLGNIVKELDRTEDALHYHTLALNIRKSLHDSSGMASSYNNIGNIYLKTGDKIEALKNYQRALDIKQRLGLMKSAATTVDNMALLYKQMGNIPLAKENFYRAMSMSHSSGNTDELLTASNRLTKLLVDENDIAAAEQLALQTRAQLPRTGFVTHRLDNALALFDIKRMLSQPDSEAYYAQIALALKDSSYNVNMVETISKLNALLRIDHYQNDIKAKGHQLDTQKNYIMALVIFLLVLFTFIYLLYRSNRKVKNANKKIETLMKELDHRVKNNLQLISDMFHLQLQVAGNEHDVSLIRSGLSRIESMNIIHRLLHKSGYSRSIEMKLFIETLIAHLTTTYSDQAAQYRILVNSDDIILDADKAIPIGLAINEIITNLFKYGNTSQNRNLQLAFTDGDGRCTLSLTDDCGYWNIKEMRNKTSGLGLYLIDTLVKQIKGNWTAVSNERGTEHVIVFDK